MDDDIVLREMPNNLNILTLVERDNLSKFSKNNNNNI